MLHHRLEILPNEFISFKRLTWDIGCNKNWHFNLR
jgi:hypothetical protein